MRTLHRQATRVLATRWQPVHARRNTAVGVSSGHVQACPSLTQGVEDVLEWQDLAYAACAAQHTSLCYVGWNNLESILQANKLQLQGSGTTYYTRWYVADGHIDISPLVDTAVQRAAGRGERDAALHSRYVMDNLDAPGPIPTRFIHLRGVAWSSTDTDSRKVWQQLGRVWPRPYVPELTHPPGILVAHTGVSSMADELFEQLLPFIESSPYPVAFIGHSLGGALAKLLMVQTRLRTNRPVEELSCMTFGSPPVLAHRDGGGGSRVLQLLGLDKTQCRNFVHEDDPVPRAMLTVDPAYRAITGLSPVKSLLQLRQAIVGEGSPLSLDRFLYENVGEVVLLRSGSEGGLTISLLDVIDETKLELSLRKMFSAPVQAMKLWLDHHYISYSQELEVAALLALKRAAQARGIKL